jgi:hypothetical protein
VKLYRRQYRRRPAPLPLKGAAAQIATDSGGASLVVLEQAAETRVADDLLSFLRRIGDPLTRAGEESVADALVRTESIVIVDE